MAFDIGCKHINIKLFQSLNSKSESNSFFTYQHCFILPSLHFPHFTDSTIGTMTDLESQHDASSGFDNLSKSLADVLYDVSNKVNGIEKLLSRQKPRKMMTTSFNAPPQQDNNSSKFDSRIISLAEEATQLLKTAKTNLDAVVRWDDRRLNKQQQLAKGRLNKEFGVLLKQFQKQQQEISEVAKKDIQLASETAKAKANEQTPLLSTYETDSYGNDTYNSVTNYPPSPFQQLKSYQQYQGQPNDQLSQAQMLDVVRQDDIDFQTSLIQERELEIQNIQEGIAEINAIFKDLGTLVTQQGDQIDTVEDNITNMSTNTRTAGDELVKANEYQRKKRKMSMCVLGVLITVLLVILIGLQA